MEGRKSLFEIDLEQRRKDLGMSRRILAKRSGVSLSTAVRVLQGDSSVSIQSLKNIASALGARIPVEPIDDPDKLIEVQARKKAEYIVRLVQGNSALEMQAVDDAARRKMIERTFRELMTGSKRRIWDE